MIKRFNSLQKHPVRVGLHFKVLRTSTTSYLQFRCAIQPHPHTKSFVVGHRTHKHLVAYVHTTVCQELMSTAPDTQQTSAFLHNLVPARYYYSYSRRAWCKCQPCCLPNVTKLCYPNTPPPPPPPPPPPRPSRQPLGPAVPSHCNTEAE